LSFAYESNRVLIQEGGNTSFSFSLKKHPGGLDRKGGLNIFSSLFKQESTKERKEET